jgi:hypothetical protein
MKTIISGIQAGGGATIALAYDKESNEVEEVKTLDDGTTISARFHMDHFDPEVYGNAGESFLDLIENL